MQSVFFTRFTQLCQSAGQSPNAVARLLGKSSGSVTAWKSGVTPRMDTVQAIAAHFGVTADYLLGHEDAAPAPISPAQLKFALWGDKADIDDDDLDDVLRYAAFVAERKRRKHDSP